MILFGPCAECSKGTMHPSWKRCEDCAKAKNKCANCDALLKSKVGNKKKKK